MENTATKQNTTIIRQQNTQLVNFSNTIIIKGDYQPGYELWYWGVSNGDSHRLMMGLV
jgi:hypothetical protein